MSDPFKAFLDGWDAEIAARDAREKAEWEAYKGCKHENLPVKYNAEECRGRDYHYVREHYPRFWGKCPDCGEQMIGYASFEHFVAGDW